LQEYDNLKFFWSDNDDILVYGKMTPDKKDVVLVVVNLNPSDTRATMVHIPPREIGVGDHQPYTVHDLITDQKWVWRGSSNFVRLDPLQEPAHLLVVSRQ
jgi:starch synthase (maltosyl-transferring)